jgi:hypothetical protein
MELSNSRVVKDEQTTQDRTRADLELYIAKLDERLSPGRIPVRKRGHLDVDGILARSLARTVGQTP